MEAEIRTLYSIMTEQNLLQENNIINQEGGKSVGSCWGDIDNDGDLDLFVTNSNSTTNFLYKNLGNGNFQKITNSIVNQGGSSHGCSFADIDNDGDLDLFVTNDRSENSFTLTTETEILLKTDKQFLIFGLSFGHAWSDYDHDGDLDLAVATHSNQKNHIFVNNGNTNKWLEINLKH
jgi:hypothetical protein